MWQWETKELLASCPFPFSPGHPQAKLSCGSNLLNPVACEHRPCFVLAFEEKFSKVYVSAHPGKQGPPSAQNLWLTRQNSWIRLCQVFKNCQSVRISWTLESALTPADTFTKRLLDSKSSSVSRTRARKTCQELSSAPSSLSTAWAHGEYYVAASWQALVPDNKDY